MKDHATARTCIRLAVRDKDFLFTAADSTKFSSMIVMSEVNAISNLHRKDSMKLTKKSYPDDSCLHVLHAWIYFTAASCRTWHGVEPPGMA